MSGRNDFWGGVGLYRGTVEARRDWEAACGSDFAVFSARYLTGTGEPVQRLICPLKCGCVHRRWRVDSEHVSYICDCDGQGCPTFSLSVKDAEGLDFQAQDFYLALAGCLGIDRGRVVYAGQMGTIHLGHARIGAAETWVFLVCVASAAEQADAVGALLQKYAHRPIAVLMPDYAPDVGALVERNGGNVIELRGYVLLAPDGSLAADKKLVELLSRQVEAERSEPVPDAVPGKYVISAKGKYVRKGHGEHRECVRWGVVFDGNECLMPETDGAQYITFLIRHPDIAFSPKDLYDAVRGLHPAGEKLDLYADWVFGGEGEEQAELIAQVRNTANARDVVWDARKIMETEILLRAWRKQVENLGEQEQGEVERLKTKISEQVVLLHANSKQVLGGKRVPLDYDVNEFTKLSGIIRKAVASCLNYIDLNLPAFGKHLREKDVFSYGMENRYRRKKIKWVCVK